MAQTLESACNAGDPGSVPGLGRFPGEGNGYPPQYLCLENPMARGAWRTTVHGVAKSQTQPSGFTFTFRGVGWRGRKEAQEGRDIYIYIYREREREI